MGLRKTESVCITIIYADVKELKIRITADATNAVTPDSMVSNDWKGFEYRKIMYVGRPVGIALDICNQSN